MHGEVIGGVTSAGAAACFFLVRVLKTLNPVKLLDIGVAWQRLVAFFQFEISASSKSTEKRGSIMEEKFGLKSSREPANYIFFFFFFFFFFLEQTPPKQWICTGQAPHE
ncbi:hypothetical protein OPV22_019347 [Ensete ventricosum]|uniref:Uncharacterized protein n=1 Tax=Ensete ventricosum TaxID=4639 RepID=A0AAV8QDK8_ENSVE|nr:hypothetical protein OPV22_019347 [Ensete ventricosum]